MAVCLTLIICLIGISVSAYAGTGTAMYEAALNELNIELGLSLKMPKDKESLENKISDRN